ncbi:hypothetical protein D9M68_527110 [compost metagenome]
MLLVERERQADRHLAQLVLHHVQRRRAELQQAAQLASGDFAVAQFDRNRLARTGGQGIGQHRAAGILGRGHGLQRINAGSRQQGLAAVRQGNADLVALLVGRDADQLVQLHYGLVALVEQVVRGAAAGLAGGQRNLRVQVVDAGQVAVDLLHGGRDLRVQTFTLILHFGVGRPDLRRQAVGLAQQVGTGCRIRGLAGHGVHAGEEIVQAGRDADGAVGEQVVDLGDLVELGLQLSAAALRADELLVQEAVVAAHDGVDLHAAADVTVAGGLGAGGGNHDALTVVTDRRGVVDVMTGGCQACLGRVQPAQCRFVQIHADNAPYLTATDMTGYSINGRRSPEFRVLPTSGGKFPPWKPRPAIGS